MKRVLVTGAGGFLGQALVRGFSSAGWVVRASDLARVDLSSLESQGTETAVLDLTVLSTLAPALEGVHTVVHNAGVFDLTADRKRLWSVNSDGASLMAEAAVSAGVKRFIMMSSTSIYGRCSSPAAENTPKRPYHAYSASKWAGEERAAAVCARHQLSTAILRPSMVYGPGSRYGIAPLFCLYTLAAERPMNPPGLTKTATTHVIHVDDVVGVALHMTAHDELQGPFNVADERPVAIQELSEAILGSLGMAPGRLKLPGQIIDVARWGKGLLGLVMKPLNARSADAWSRLCREHHLEEALSPRVDVDWFDFLSHDTTFDISRLRDSGYTFIHPSIDTGIPHTAHWYRSNRWLPPSS